MKPFRLYDRIKSFAFASSGIIALFCKEHNARIHLFAAALVVAGAFAFNITRNEWLFLILCIGFVLTAEAFNTAVEKLADRVTENEDKKIKLVKDLAAGAVLLASITAAITGCIVFLPYVIDLYSALF